MKSIGGSRQILIYFPAAMLVVSKAECGILHYVIFDKRPKFLGLELKQIENKVYIIVPYDFSPRLLFTHPFWNKFLDIVILGNVELDYTETIENIRLYLSHQVKELYKRKWLTQNILIKVNYLAHYVSQLKSMPSYQLTYSVTDIIRRCFLFDTTNLQLNFGDTIYERQIPRRVKIVLNSIDCGKNKYYIAKLLHEICTANIHITGKENLFFHIIENEDYDEIISTLLKLCRNEVSFLKKHCKLFFWYNEKEKKIVFKVFNSKSHNKKLLFCLQEINRCLQNTFNKELLSLSNKQFILTQEEYNIRNFLLTDFENNILNISNNLFLSNEILGTQKIATEVYVSIISNLIVTMKNSVAKEFLKYLRFNWLITDSVKRKELVYFLKFDKEIRYRNKIMSNQFDFLRIRNSSNIDNIFYCSRLDTTILIGLIKKFYDKVNDYCKSSKFDMVIGDSFYFYVHDLRTTKKNIFLFKQLRILLEKIASNLGLNEENRNFAAFANLKLIAIKKKSLLLV